jgi:hypothetical protein
MLQLHAILLIIIIAPSLILAQDPPAFASYNTASRQYDVGALWPPSAEGPGITFRASVGVGGPADTAVVHFLGEACRGESSPRLWTSLKAWRPSSSRAIRLSLAEIEEISEADSLHLDCAGRSRAISYGSLLPLRDLAAAMKSDSALARVAAGPGATVSDLRAPPTIDEVLRDLSSWRITYDRFEHPSHPTSTSCRSSHAFRSS